MEQLYNLNNLIFELLIAVVVSRQAQNAKAGGGRGIFCLHLLKCGRHIDTTVTILKLLQNITQKKFNVSTVYVFLHKAM